MNGTTHYKRTVSADDSGFQYELKMTALAAMRLYNQTDEFYLANNFDAGEKFDDLVFTAAAQGRWTTWFIQLKHKQKSSLAARKITLASLTQETKANKNDYNIIKYFESYKAIGRKFHPGSKDPIFGRGFDGARFVVFTNSILGQDVSDKEYKSVQIDLLSTNAGKEVNLKFDPKKDVALFSGIPEKTLLADFLSKFWLCSSQSSEDAVDGILNEEIKRASPALSAVEVNYVNGQIKDYIRKWYKTREYLTRDNVRSLLLKTSVETQSGKSGEVDIKLLPFFLKQVQENLHKEPIMIYMSNAANVLLCEAALRQLELLNEPNIYANVKQLENNDFRIMLQEKWLVSNGTTLIINLECDVVQIDIKGIGDFITKLCKDNKKNFVIMLSTTSNKRAQQLQVAIGAKKRNFTCILTHMHDDVKTRLMESTVLFQGHETSLSSIMPTSTKVHMEQVFAMSSISDLLRGQMANIGLKPLESISYYITRVLVRNCILPTVFETCHTGTVFAIGGVTLDSAKEKLASYADLIVSASQFLVSPDVNARIIVLENVCFDEVAAKTGDLHWLEKHKNLWAWKRSTANVVSLAPYMSHIFDFTPTDSIMKIQDKVVVVIAEPGMGKSTLLVHMAAETKRLNPHIWVVLVTLNDFTDRMAADDFVQNIEKNVKAIVAEAAGITAETSKFNSRLFDHCYDVSGKMIILLDGFDEITPYYTAEGLALVRVLQNSKIERVWVTARPIMRDQLLKSTNIIPYNIKAFTAKDQKDFLSKFWVRNISDIKQEKLNEFIEKVLSLVSSSFDGESDEFYGIPLQTRMLAETFETELNVFHQTGILTLPSKINRLELFEAFVGKKLNILDEKAKVVATNAVSRNQAQMWRKSQEVRLMKLALLTMLNHEQCARLVPPLLPFEILELKDEVAKGEEKTGIVVSYKGEVPQFIHRTFAEYFVARFFESHLKENLEFLTSETYDSSSFNLVRYFLDRLLAKDCKLHEAVLNQNYDDLNVLLSEKSVDINKIDLGGRTALHLAASQKDAEQVICMLLEAGADISKVDSVFNWTAMQFAVKCNDMGNVAPLVERKHFSNFPTDILPIDWKTLKKAVEGDYLDLFLGLLENGIVTKLGIDVLPPQPWVDDNIVEGMTYLHLAASHGAIRILEYLLRRDTRDSKLWLLERVNSEGYTALQVAAQRNHSKCAGILLNAGANILATNANTNKNIIDLTIENYDTELLLTALAKLKDNTQLSPEAFLIGALTAVAGNKSGWACTALQLLLASYPQLLHCNTKKDVPVIAVAVTKGNDVAVKMMLDLGVNVNQTIKGSSLLHMAVRSGWESTVSLLLEIPSVLVDQQDELGQTPLFVATNRGFFGIIEILINAGASIHCITKDGSNLSHAAAHSANAAIVSYLLSKGVDFNSVNLNSESSLSILTAAGEDVLVDFIRTVKAPKMVVCDRSVEHDDEVDNGKKPAEFEPDVIESLLNLTVTAPKKRVRKKKNSNTVAIQQSNFIQPLADVHFANTPPDPTQPPPANFMQPHTSNAKLQSQAPKKVNPPKVKKVKPKPQPAAQAQGFQDPFLLNLIRELTGKLNIDNIASIMRQQTQPNPSKNTAKAKNPHAPGAQNHPKQKKKVKNPPNPTGGDAKLPQPNKNKNIQQPAVPKNTNQNGKAKEAPPKGPNQPKKDGKANQVPKANQARKNVPNKPKKKAASQGQGSASAAPQ